MNVFFEMIGGISIGGLKLFLICRFLFASIPLCLLFFDSFRHVSVRFWPPFLVGMFWFVRGADVRCRANLIFGCICILFVLFVFWNIGVACLIFCLVSFNVIFC